MTIAGYCECGCGERTALSKKTSRKEGRVKGQHNRFLPGHHKGHWKGGRTLTTDGNISVWKPSYLRASNGYVREHILVAEKALGKPLPKGAVLHHHNEDRTDNRPENLVICQDRAYHALLHRRMRAKAACGHADWRMCVYCKEHDDPKNMVVRPGLGKEAFHRECRNAYERERQAKHRDEINAQRRERYAKRKEAAQ